MTLVKFFWGTFCCQKEAVILAYNGHFHEDGCGPDQLRRLWKLKRGGGLVQYAVLAGVHLGFYFNVEKRQETAVLQKVLYVSWDVDTSPLVLKKTTGFPAISIFPLLVSPSV